MQLTIVVLPAPLGPISPRIVSPATSKETPSRATMPPNRMLTSWTESRAFAMRVSLSAAVQESSGRSVQDSSSGSSVLGASGAGGGGGGAGGAGGRGGGGPAARGP